MSKCQIITSSSPAIATIPKGSTVVGGCFDILHIGHIRFLEAVSRVGNPVVVFLESDEFITTRKHRKPVHTQQERAEMLVAVRYVDYVILLPQMQDADYGALIEKLSPAVIGITEGDPHIAKKEFHARNHGILVRAFPLTNNTSTTSILKRGITNAEEKQ